MIKKVSAVRQIIGLESQHCEKLENLIRTHLDQPLNANQVKKLIRRSLALVKKLGIERFKPNGNEARSERAYRERINKLTLMTYFLLVKKIDELKSEEEKKAEDPERAKSVLLFNDKQQECFKVLEHELFQLPFLQDFEFNLLNLFTNRVLKNTRENGCATGLRRWVAHKQLGRSFQNFERTQSQRVTRANLNYRLSTEDQIFHTLFTFYGDAGSSKTRQHAETLLRLLNQDGDKHLQKRRLDTIKERSELDAKVNSFLRLPEKPGRQETRLQAQQRRNLESEVWRKQKTFYSNLLFELGVGSFLEKCDDAEQKKEISKTVVTRFLKRFLENQITIVATKFDLDLDKNGIADLKAYLVKELVASIKQQLTIDIAEDVAQALIDPAMNKLREAAKAQREIVTIQVISDEINKFYDKKNEPSISRMVSAASDSSDGSDEDKADKDLLSLSSFGPADVAELPAAMKLTIEKELTTFHKLKGENERQEFVARLVKIHDKLQNQIYKIRDKDIRSGSKLGKVEDKLSQDQLDGAYAALLVRNNPEFAQDLQRDLRETDCLEPLRKYDDDAVVRRWAVFLDLAIVDTDKDKRDASVARAKERAEERFVEFTERESRDPIPDQESQEQAFSRWIKFVQRPNVIKEMEASNLRSLRWFKIRFDSTLELGELSTLEQQHRWIDERLEEVQDKLTAYEAYDPLYELRGNFLGKGKHLKAFREQYAPVAELYRLVTDIPKLEMIAAPKDPNKPSEKEIKNLSKLAAMKNRLAELEPVIIDLPIKGSEKTRQGKLKEFKDYLFLIDELSELKRFKMGMGYQQHSLEGNDEAVLKSRLKEAYTRYEEMEALEQRLQEQQEIDDKTFESLISFLRFNLFDSAQKNELDALIVRVFPDGKNDKEQREARFLREDFSLFIDKGYGTGVSLKCCGVIDFFKQKQIEKNAVRILPEFRVRLTRDLRMDFIELIKSAPPMPDDQMNFIRDMVVFDNNFHVREARKLVGKGPETTPVVFTRGFFHFSELQSESIELEDEHYSELSPVKKIEFFKTIVEYVAHHLKDDYNLVPGQENKAIAARTFVVKAKGECAELIKNAKKETNKEQFKKLLTRNPANYSTLIQYCFAFMPSELIFGTPYRYQGIQTPLFERTILPFGAELLNAVKELIMDGTIKTDDYLNPDHNFIKQGTIQRFGAIHRMAASRD